MGSLNSHNQANTSQFVTNSMNTQKNQFFITDQLDSSFRSSRTREKDNQKLKQSFKKQQLELNENKNQQKNIQKIPIDQPTKRFNKLSVKSQQIHKMNQMLNDQIHNYKHQTKNKLLNQDKKPKKRKIVRKYTQLQSVILGIWIGITISIVIVLIVIINIFDLSIANESQFSRDFPTWRGIAIWIFYVWMIGFDVSMYEKYKVRYRQIFKIQRHHYPQPVNIFRIAAFQSSAFVVLFLLYVLDITDIHRISGFSGTYYAAMSWGFFIAFLFMPLPILSNKGRYFIFSLFIDSLLSPFRGVAFPVIWMTDQAVSMAVPLKDLQYTFCYYTQLDFQSDQNACLDTNRVSTVMIVAVSVCSIRMIQCMRQGYDKGEYFFTPFFFNTLKYAATICTAVFAFLYKLGADDIQAAWLLFAVISSVYSFSWDVKMDWDLFQKNKFHPFLRQKLIFGAPRVYYLIMIGNFVMRLAWIMTISPKIAQFLGNSNLVSLLTGMIEIFRRGVWNLLRIQKEHIALIAKPVQSNSKLQQKALQLQKKLSIVEHSLDLQIKVLKFFKKFENNREHLKNQLLKSHQDNIQKHTDLVETYKQKFEQEQIKQISQLMNKILTTDVLLKQRIEQKQVGFIPQPNQIFFKDKQVQNHPQIQKQNIHQLEDNFKNIEIQKENKLQHKDQQHRRKSLLILKQDQKQQITNEQKDKRYIQECIQG